jgi:hypothetical protein
MSAIEDPIEHWLARIAASPPSERTALVRIALQGKANVETSEGKRLLHQRALLVSALREQRLWP